MEQMDGSHTIVAAGYIVSQRLTNIHRQTAREGFSHNDHEDEDASAAADGAATVIPQRRLYHGLV